jgi:YNFM family putative membrane transporter
MAHATWVVLAGLAVMTFGFFGAHAVVSAWIGVRARNAKAVASSFYLFFYYSGSSVAGTLAGVFWSAKGWAGVTAIVCTLLALGLVVVFALRNLPTEQDTAPFSETPAV